jgi:hypothetical protein
MRMPVVEPGNLQELKDWINLSFKLSQAAGLYIGYIVTVAHADGGGTVDCKPNQFPTINTNDRVAIDTANLPLDKTVLLPPRTWKKELLLEDRYQTTMDTARRLGPVMSETRTPYSRAARRMAVRAATTPRGLTPPPPPRTRSAVWPPAAPPPPCRLARSRAA